MTDFKTTRRDALKYAAAAAGAALLHNVASAAEVDGAASTLAAR